MKLSIVIFLLLFLFHNSSYPQNSIISDNNKYDLNIENIDHIQIPPPSIDLIKMEDSENEKNGTMMRIGRLLPIDITMENSGNWENINDTAQVWKLRISSKGAKASALHFDYFDLPENSELSVYNIDKSITLGPYTSKDNPQGLEYVIGILPNNDLIIEYSQKTNEKTPNIKIGGFAYIYKGEDLLTPTLKTGYGTSGECQVNVNCPEGYNWRKQQKGIARVYAVNGSFIGYCTGSLINNTSNDGTPYFLTSLHCGEDATTSQFRQWKFRFDYESSECESIYEPIGYTITGSTKIASAPLDGGSDFLLLKLNTTSKFLQENEAVYNGWNNENIGSDKGVTIHHPNGDIKKISTYTTSLASATYISNEGTGLTNGCWKVHWSKTTNGYGVTEGGSSGSPIFNNDGFIIGTLSGGTTSCSYLTGADYYAKFSYHWDKNGNSSDSQLKQWLDPNNSGTTKCNYFDPNDNLIVNFYTNTTNTTAGNFVNFINLTQNAGGESEYFWSFNGGIPSTSTEKSPSVIYFNEGIFDVSLTVNTKYSSSTETKKSYIVVNKLNITNNLSEKINIYPNPVSDILNIDFNESIHNSWLTIYDILGHIVFHEKLSESNSFNLSYLKQGLYFVDIKIDEAHLIEKISIK